MSSILSGMNAGALLLAAEEGMVGRIFGLDMQLLVDAAILAIAVFALFVALSYLLFNPARDFLKKRQDKIQQEIDTAAKNQKDAENYKAEYDTKLKAVGKEADQILSESRKRGLQREAEIVEEAKVEAGRIISRAEKDAELEKAKMKDEVKKEMISVAAMMAGKIISTSIDEDKQSQLIDETLKEMGDQTWQS